MKPLTLLALVCLPFRFAASADPLAVSAAAGGRVHILGGEEVLCTLAPMAANASWAFSQGVGMGEPSDGKSDFSLTVNDRKLAGRLTLVPGKSGAFAGYRFEAVDAVEFQTLAVATSFDVSRLAGTNWSADETQGEFPPQFAKAHLFSGKVGRLVLRPAKEPELVFEFPQPTLVILQDNRQWGNADFTLRLCVDRSGLAPGEVAEIGLRIEKAAFDGKPPKALQPVVMAANADWIPLRQELDIAPGSALDLSDLVTGPCGAKGRVIVNAAGKFAYAGEPDRPVRFYGVNLCFSAQYLTHKETDRLLDRLVRLGYNSVRLHHYEGGLMKPPAREGFDWDPERVDQLDYLMAGCAKRGLWLTTDLFTSRPIGGKQIGLPEDRIEMDRYKLLVPVHEPAFADWKIFAKKFLDRVNPHTGKRIADDPALAWISLINEGPLANNWSAIRQMPEWQAAWNTWLAKRYPSRKELGARLGDLSQAESPEAGNVVLPPELSGGAPRSQLAAAFIAEMESQTYSRMRDFLRKDLKCEALLTNMNNAGPTSVPSLVARETFDYVDEHFYVDHPQFLEKPWRLPSSCPNTNPIASGAEGGLGVASTRLYGKPFTITEYNYSGPGRYRGVGGILTGALAALQDWDAVWRFAYSHNKESLFQPAPIHYFDLSSDALNLAADRLTLFLYLRGDLAPAKTRYAAIISGSDGPEKKGAVAALRRWGWVGQIGCWARPENNPSGLIVPPAGGPKSTFLGTDDNLLSSDTGEIHLDPSQAALFINTPRSAGGYAEAGQGFGVAGRLAVSGLQTGATVFINSLDSAPLEKSRRLLVTHLTDLQNTGARYAEGAKKTLLDWGGLPHLVRDGSARLSLAVANPEKLTVWALSVGGRRVETVPSKIEDGRLVFTASVKGKEGARMLYEIAEQ